MAKGPGKIIRIVLVASKNKVICYSDVKAAITATQNVGEK